jgi:hypothetical protein
MASDMKYWDIFRDPKWLLDNFLKRYKLIIVPTNAGWTTSNAGSGTVSQKPVYLYVGTGTTANSRGMVYTDAYFLNSGDISQSLVDWTKHLEVRFVFDRLGNDPECVARFQIKEANTEGALAQRGIGLEIQNLAMYGEGYGTARGTVSLGSVTSGRYTRVRIVKSAGRMDFYVNDALMGTLTGGYVPNVKGTSAAYIVISIVNGPTGGVSAYFEIGNIKIIQEW